MKTRDIILAASVLFLFAGCATAPDTSDIAVRVGMSRNEVKRVYGEPLRIESNGHGGEDWYYRFYSWAKGPIASSENYDVGGDRTSSSSVGWQIPGGTEEEPIHLSPEGYVVEPLPSGKVVKN